MIWANLKLGVKFDWIGGDGLYGHNAELTRGLDAEKLFYVPDVHRDELIYQAEPAFSIPPEKGTRGANPTKEKADKPELRIDECISHLIENQCYMAKVRKTTKGWKYVWVHTVAVCHWKGKEEKARARTLVITRTKEKKPKVKFSFGNVGVSEYSREEYAYFQCARYWVERCFDDAKNELGLSG